MSTDIYEGDGLYVVRLVGPAAEGEDRRRWQITIPEGQTTLRFDDVRALVEALARSLYDRPLARREA